MTFDEAMKDLQMYRSREPLVNELVLAALNDDNCSRRVDDAVSALRARGWRIPRADDAD